MGQLIKENFANPADANSHINGTQLPVDALTPGNNTCTSNLLVSSCYWDGYPAFNSNSSPPRPVGYMHSHPFDNTCFSPTDLLFFSDRCGEITDPVKKENYFKDAIGIMVNNNSVYSFKITDVNAMCTLLNSHTPYYWDEEFKRIANKPISVTNLSGNTDKQGQVVAFIELFGKVVSLQKADFDTNGDLGAFEHLETIDAYYLNSTNTSISIKEPTTRQCDDYRKN